MSQYCDIEKQIVKLNKKNPDSSGCYENDSKT